MKDSQRRRVYEAGWAVHHEMGFLGQETTRALANSLGCSLSWGRRNLSDHAGDYSSGWACWDRRLIRISPNRHGAASLEVILHEVAHVWMPVDDGTLAWHGPEFCRVFLDLVERVQGWDKRMVLARAFTEHRVRVAVSVPLRWRLDRWRWPKPLKS